MVLISNTSSKGKLTNGPAHLRVQNYGFCITVGIPPRLVGIWKLAHLRRYGVVDGRFCFEGGSQCDRGQGLHVLITDQGDEIVKVFHLAVEGKLSSRKKTVGRKQGSQESPHSQFSRSETRVSDLISFESYASNYRAKYCDACKNENSSYWCSTERRQEVESKGCFSSQDSVSTSELIEQPSDWQNFSFSCHESSGLERCASCIGKLGTISKSSTYVTTVETSKINGSGLQPNNLSHLTHRALDGLSLSSYSSSSHESEYSVSQKDANFQQTECFCSQTDLEQTNSTCLSLLSPVVPPRPPKLNSEFTNIAKMKKPPMPLPNTTQTCICPQKKNLIFRSNVSIGPYNNYDFPKPILNHRVSLNQAESQNQNYDTPRKIKECIALPNVYSNYDMPHIPQAVMLQQCGCPTKLAQTSRSSVCPCQNVMSWAGFVLPYYCRRGAGIESTGVTIEPVHLSGEGKMPVVNANGKVNFFHKNLSAPQASQTDKCEYSSRSTENNDRRSKANYENIDSVIDTQPNASTPNYVNIDFKQSLEHYENSKDLILKSKLSKNGWKQISNELHVSTEDKKESKKASLVKEKEVDYLEVEFNNTVPNCSTSGYLPMQHAHNPCSKQVLYRLISGAKSSSNPTLSRLISTDGIKKRSESEYRVPGSAILSSPYFRRRFISGKNKNERCVLLRKRSYSEESALFINNGNSSLPSNFTICDCPSKLNKKSLSITEDPSANKMENVFLTLHQLSFSMSSSGSCIKIRRSSSVPSKTGHNRDSSSSNDSGVYTGSNAHRNNEIIDTVHDSDMSSIPLKRKQTTFVGKKPLQAMCFHNSLPRKSKSSDLRKEITFQFQKVTMPTKSSSIEADISSKETKRFINPVKVTCVTCPDSQSTSSGTSDMSDYIETLSLSSHSSTETPDCLR